MKSLTYIILHSLILLITNQSWSQPSKWSVGIVQKTVFNSFPDFESNESDFSAPSPEYELGLSATYIPSDNFEIQAQTVYSRLYYNVVYNNISIPSDSGTGLERAKSNLSYYADVPILGKFKFGWTNFKFHSLTGFSTAFRIVSKERTVYQNNTVARTKDPNYAVLFGLQIGTGFDIYFLQQRIRWSLDYNYRWYTGYPRNRRWSIAIGISYKLPSRPSTGGS